MKKLLLLPLLLLAFMVKAQLPVLRAPDGVTVEDTRLYVLKNLRVPVFTDSTAANVAKGLDSVGTLFFKRGTRFVFVRTVDANGTHKWDTLGGTSSGGGVSGDTVFLYQIGTAAGQIETLYAVDGNLRKSRWVPGYGTLPFLAPDSAAYINVDTASIAYKTWVISLFGTSINNLQQVIDNGNALNKTDTIAMGAFDLRLTGTQTLALIGPVMTTRPSYLSDYAASLGYSGNGVSAQGVISMRDFSTGGGNTVELTSPISIPSTFILYLPEGNDGDTLATKAYARSVGGGGGTQTTIQTTSTYSGSTSFTFTTVPAGFEDYMIFKNGILLIPTTDYTTSGNVVTIPTATTGDKIIYRRIK